LGDDAFGSEAQLGDEAGEDGGVFLEGVGAGLDEPARGRALAGDGAAEAGTGFEETHGNAGANERIGGGEAGDATADDGDAGGGGGGRRGGGGRHVGSVGS
jgi:hypothetical protein